MGGLLRLVQRGRSPPRPLLAVPNVTAHPPTASIPIAVLLYNGPLLCGFNVPAKGLSDEPTMLALLYCLISGFCAAVIIAVVDISAFIV